LLKISDLKRDYHFVSYNSDKKIPKDITSDIEKIRKSKKNKKLIVLVGGMLELGCSIDYADNVIMMNDSKSPDAYLQRIYRSLTENIKNGKIIKKQGSIIDFNPNRVLSNTMSFFKSNGSKKLKDHEIMELIIKKKMVRIFNDDMEIKTISQNNIEQVYETMKSIDIVDTDLYDFNENINNLSKSEILKSMKGSVSETVEDVIIMYDKKEKREVKSYDSIKISSSRKKELIKDITENIMLLQNKKEISKNLFNFMSVRSEL